MVGSSSGSIRGGSLDLPDHSNHQFNNANFPALAGDRLQGYMAAPPPPSSNGTAAAASSAATTNPSSAVLLNNNETTTAGGLVNLNNNLSYGNVVNNNVNNNHNNNNVNGADSEHGQSFACLLSGGGQAGSNGGASGPAYSGSRYYNNDFFGNDNHCGGGGIRQSSGDFGSLDSGDTFLSSSNTHPFPSQGSLAGLEALAAQGSMAANGSINNSVYVNPFDPGRGLAGPDYPPRPPLHHRGSGKGARTRDCDVMPAAERGAGFFDSVKAVTPSPKGSPQRRVRIAARSRSSDLSDFDLMDRETCVMEEFQPKHRRARVSQSNARAVADFGVQSTVSNKISAALNQGLSSLGQKLGKGSAGHPAAPIQPLAKPAGLQAAAPSQTHSRKSILKRSDSTCQHRGDQQAAGLLRCSRGPRDDEDSAAADPEGRLCSMPPLRIEDDLGIGQQRLSSTPKRRLHQRQQQQAAAASAFNRISWPNSCSTNGSAAILDNIFRPLVTGQWSHDNLPLSSTAAAGVSRTTRSTNEFNPTVKSSSSSIEDKSRQPLQVVESWEKELVMPSRGRRPNEPSGLKEAKTTAKLDSPAAKSGHVASSRPKLNHAKPFLSNNSADCATRLSGDNIQTNRTASTDSQADSRAGHSPFRTHEHQPPLDASCVESNPGRDHEQAQELISLLDHSQAGREEYATREIQTVTRRSKFERGRDKQSRSPSVNRSHRSRWSWAAESSPDQLTGQEGEPGAASDPPAHLAAKDPDWDQCPASPSDESSRLLPDKEPETSRDGSAPRTPSGHNAVTSS